MIKKSGSKSIVMHQNNAQVLQKMIAGLTVNEANQFKVMLKLKKQFLQRLRSVAILKSTDPPCWNISLKCVDILPNGIPDDVKEDVNTSVEKLGFEAYDFRLIQIFLPTAAKNTLQFNLRPKTNE